MFIITQRVTHANFDADNGVPPGRHRAIVGTKAGMVSDVPMETPFSDILNQIIAMKTMFHVTRQCLRPNLMRIMARGLIGTRSSSAPSEQGPVSPTVPCPQPKFDGNFVSL